MNAPDQRSDQDLAISLAKGDASASATLAQRYAPGIYDFAVRVTLDPAAAEQTTENSLRRLDAEIKTRPNGLSFLAWIFGIARDEALEGLRQRARDDGSRDEVRAGGLSPMDPRFVKVNGDIPADAAAWAWGSARGQRPRDYSILDLLLRRNITPEDVADIASLSRNGVYGVIGRLRGGFEESFIAAALFASGRGNCRELASLISDTAGLGPALRRDISRHAETCASCQATKAKLPAAADVFTALEKVDVPDGLADRLLPLMLAAMPGVEASTSEAAAPGSEKTAEAEMLAAESDVAPTGGTVAAGAAADEAPAAAGETPRAEAEETAVRGKATRSPATQAALFGAAGAASGGDAEVEVAATEPVAAVPDHATEAAAASPAAEDIEPASPVEAELTPPEAIQEPAVEAIGESLSGEADAPDAAAEAAIPAGLAEDTPVDEESPKPGHETVDKPLTAEQPDAEAAAYVAEYDENAEEHPAVAATASGGPDNGAASAGDEEESDEEEERLAAGGAARHTGGGWLLMPSTVGGRTLRSGSRSPAAAEPGEAGGRRDSSGRGAEAGVAAAAAAGPFGAGGAAFPRQREPIGAAAAAGGRGGPPARPFRRPIASDDGGRWKKYGIYAFAVLGTAVALYVGIAVGDSLQSGGGGDSSGGALPTRAAGITEAACPGPISLNQGSRVSLTFSNVPAGYELDANPGIRPVSPTSAVTQVEAVAQQGNSVLFSANTVPNSNGRTDEYRITATFSRNSDRQPQECTVRVIGPGQAAPTATPPATAPTNTAVPATATQPPVVQPQPTQAPAQPTAVPTATPDLSTPTPSVPTPIPTAGGTLISPTEVPTAVPTPAPTRTPLPPL